MPVIHVRSVSEDLLVRLQARAKGHHRSMESEVRAILSDAVQPIPPLGLPRHVNFELIARTGLSEMTFEPLRPVLRELEL